MSPGLVLQADYFLSFMFIHVHAQQQEVKDKTYRTLGYGI